MTRSDPPPCDETASEETAPAEATTGETPAAETPDGRSLDGPPGGPADGYRLADVTRPEGHLLEFAYVVLVLNVVFVVVEDVRWWNLVMVAVAVRFGLAVAIRRYRVPVDRPG